MSSRRSSMGLSALNPVMSTLYMSSTGKSRCPASGNMAFRESMSQFGLSGHSPGFRVERIDA